VSALVGFDVVALSALSLALAAAAMVLRGRQAILLGNWLLHRQRMLAALGLWAAALGLALAQLLVIGTASPLVLGALLLAALAVSVLLLRVLVLMARHRLLEHKLLARRVIWLWLAAAAGLAAGFAAQMVGVSA
jgi:hypothetical protein